MVNKKDTHELLYRVFGIETTAKDAGKEAIYQKNLEAVRKVRDSTEPESKVTTELESSAPPAESESESASKTNV